MTFHTAFDRIHSDEPGVFLQDSHFRSSEYRAWLDQYDNHKPTHGK